MNSSFSFVCIVLLLFYYVDWVTIALPWAVLFERRYLFTSHCTNYYDTNDDTMILHDKKENEWYASTRLNQECTNMANSDLLMVYRTTSLWRAHQVQTMKQPTLRLTPETTREGPSNPASILLTSEAIKLDCWIHRTFPTVSNRRKTKINMFAILLQPSRA